jgi:hypothetical protein
MFISEGQNIFQRWIKEEDKMIIKKTEYINLQESKYINDLSPFQNCIFVDLSSSDNSVNDNNLHLLSKIRILRLYNCQEITNVACLSNVYDLNLDYCSKIQDVSMLGNVHRLNISNCYEIEDISSLGTVRYLTIKNLKQLDDWIFDSNNLKLKEIVVSENTLHILEDNDLSDRLIVVSGDFRKVEVEDDCKHLRFEDNEETLPCLQDLSEIHSLSLIKCSLSDGNNIFAYFQFLIKLEIRKPFIHEPLFIDFISLPSLQDIICEECTFIGMDIRGKNMKKIFLKILILEQTVLIFIVILRE